MFALRQFFRDRPTLAALLLAAVLCLKIVMPAGYMPQAQGEGIVVALCSSAADGASVLIRVGQKDGHEAAGKAMDHPCIFASHGAAMLGAAPPAIALAALLFVFAVAILRRPLALPAPGGQIRPPLRGPPLPA
ncbi:hypothetical protein SAMN05518801_104175 [Novosphingobium sp. CF614]|uniref:hypothetical protein n=1 Tax=Novosphingobium sp. CF614 TaxID=1884364 RepID=UPI0008F31E7E|nr:hypothetical protein [Novosphingobium sp. CF614]SFF96096.1 hypothetical protein SAMN05518801_104175 [Novosphingobium sp. CF614]